MPDTQYPTPVVVAFTLDELPPASACDDDVALEAAEDELLVAFLMMLLLLPLLKLLPTPPELIDSELKPVAEQYMPGT